MSFNTVKALTAPTRDTHINWSTNNPILPDGVMGIVKDRLCDGSLEFFIGDGTTAYNDLVKSGSIFVMSSDLATEEAAGIARIATSEEAKAGTDDTTIMTPAKTQEVINDVMPDVVEFQEVKEDVAELKSQVEILNELNYVDSDDDVYGVEVDFVNKQFTRLGGAVGLSAGEDFDKVNAFGGRKRCIVTDGGVVVAYYGDDNFTATGALTTEVAVSTGEGSSTTYPIGTAVQVMVEQPKFYYKVVPITVENLETGALTRKVRYYVSDTEKDGYKVHPAFVCNGVENDKIYLAAFEGCLWDYSANAYITTDSQVINTSDDKLSSIADAKPMSGLSQSATRANMRLIAENRGSGWELSYAATVCMSELLMLIEYASFNMQTAIGEGNVNRSDDSSSNLSDNTGSTLELGNASGEVLNSSSRSMISYRGEENFWGNIWTFIDGFNLQYASSAYSVYIADHDFTDGTSDSPYTLVPITPVTSSGYISAFCYCEDFDWLFIAGEVEGNSALPVGDYVTVTTSNGWYVGVLGGRWLNGAQAGAFFWYLGSASSYRNRAVGGRLVFIPSQLESE